MDWSKLPDLAAVALLAAAFAAVARRGHAASVSVLWLTGWALIALHFAAFLFAPAAGSLGVMAVFIGVGSLVWAGLLFTWAAVPYRRTPSSVAMLVTLMGTNLLYVGIILIYPSHPWALNTAAALLGVLPLAVALAALPANNHPMRWTVVGLYGALSIFLLVFQNRSGDGLTLPLNALMFSVYFGCSLHFLHAYRRKTMGEFITIAGFVSWAGVFVVGPSLGVLLPAIQLENEVWNLPKYVVAVGMILMLLEEQIADNKYLALHDELTGAAQPEALSGPARECPRARPQIWIAGSAATDRPGSIQGSKRHPWSSCRGSVTQTCW